LGLVVDQSQSHDPTSEGPWEISENEVTDEWEEAVANPSKLGLLGERLNLHADPDSGKSEIVDIN
jgi:hypothetical protein